MLKTHAFMSYAFRPFFLLNGLFAIVVISVWLMALHGTGPASVPATNMYWHGHEMLVGFGMAESPATLTVSYALIAVGGQMTLFGE